jgi:alkylation response protein AidB-like acyl-CoA dehydrogenase
VEAGEHTVGENRDVRLARKADLGSALADERGVPCVGRPAEHRLLQAAGMRDLAWGRLYEGHVNALQLIGRLGSLAQRAGASRDLDDRQLYGVWNTEANDGVRIVTSDADGIVLAGRKTFASGAGRVTRALITAQWPDGGRQLVLVPMDRVQTVIDPSFWRDPLGMEASDSFAVDFSGVRVARSAVIGEPGAYEGSPWFSAGASRFVAVQTGGIVGLVRGFAAFLRRRGAEDAPVQAMRLGECVVAARTAALWVDACVAAWERFDAAPAAAHVAELLTTVDAARYAVERAALDVMERVERGVGARGLLDSEPFARRIRDLRMYLRQPAVDAVVDRIAQAALSDSDVIS